MKIIRLHEVPNPVPQTAIPGDELDRSRRQVIELLARMPLHGSLLSPEQRSQLAARLDLESRTIVLAAAEGLRLAPQLFPDLSFDGAALEAAQDEADAALRLWACLDYFAGLAHDHYLIAQSEAATKARGLCRMAATSPVADGLQAARLGALGLAPMRLAERAERVVRGRRAARRLRKAAP